MLAEGASNGVRHPCELRLFGHRDRPPSRLEVLCFLKFTDPGQIVTRVRRSVTFSVDDANATAARAAELGGKAIVPPRGPLEPIDDRGRSAGGDVHRQQVRPREQEPRLLGGRCGQRRLEATANVDRPYDGRKPAPRDPSSQYGPFLAGACENGGTAWARSSSSST